MAVNIEDLRYWPILNFVPATALKNIRLVYVFGHGGSDVILATNDDEVTTFGFNKYFCLGYVYPDPAYYETPLETIGALSEKRVKGFASNMHSAETAFVLAYLECGEVYIWGQDPAGKRIFKVPSLIDALPKTVTEVACGNGHILALTSDGEVFGWGDNSKKQVTRTNQAVIFRPIQIKEALTFKRVVKICCGFHFSVVVTVDGVVYSWGQNNKGQLGLNMVSRFEGTPREIKFPENAFIKNIACGSNHVLALDSNGVLFSWGSNNCRQIGCAGVQQRSFPLKMCDAFRYKEVAASNNVSVTLSTLYGVYVWGQAVGDSYTDCLLTPCRTIDEAFALYNCGRMYKPIEISSENETVSESIGKSFGDQADSDFKFIVGGKEIHVHKTVLKLRSQYFKRMFNEHWLEANRNSTEINENYKAMVVFLKYLYTDKLEKLYTDDHEVDTRLVLEVSVIAVKYCESNLLNVCLRRFEENLYYDNVAELYELACEHKMTDFSELCINFAAYHLQEIITSEGFHNWKFDTYKSFFGQDKIIEACKK